MSYFVHIKIRIISEQINAKNDFKKSRPEQIRPSLVNIVWKRTLTNHYHIIIDHNKPSLLNIYYAI